MILLFLAPAHAWQTETERWDAERFPLRWCVPEDPNADIDLGPLVGEQARLWQELEPCSGVAFEAVADCETADIVVGWDLDGLNDEGATATIYATGTDCGPLAPADWCLDHVDILLTPGTDLWVTADDPCDGQLVVESYLAHAVGRALGLQSFCGEGQTCTQAESEATLNWALFSCEVREPNEADAEALNDVYGKPLTHDLSWTVDDAEDEVCFTLDGDPPDDLEVLWIFDGGHEQAAWDVCHTWEVWGNHTAQVQVSDSATGCVLAGNETSWTFWLDGPPSEGGPDAGSLPEEGCGCATGPAPAGFALPLAFAGLAALRRRWPKKDPTCDPSALHYTPKMSQYGPERGNLRP